MKRLVYSKETLIPHLRDILHQINFINFCENVMRIPCTISCAEELPDGVDLTDEQSLITLTDEQLQQLSVQDISNFTNTELLNRLARIDRSKLTLQQRNLLKASNKNKFIIDEQDVVDLIAKLKACKRISYSGQHVKTNSFALDSNGDFREDDCRNIIKNLKLADYVSSGYSDNDLYLGNNIIIFEPRVNWKANNGMIFKNLLLYVKLDMDLTNNVVVALISLHDTNKEDLHPYK